MSPLRLEVPPLGLRPRPFGLFSSYFAGVGLPLAPGVNSATGEGWGNGVYIEAGVGRVVVNLLDLCDNTKITHLATASQPASGWIADSFGIEAYDDCTSTFGLARILPPERNLKLLDLVTESAVEHELWTGALRQAAGLDARRLASPSATAVAGGTALKPPDALALLEEAWASSWPDVVGVVHAPVAAGSALVKRAVKETHAAGPLDAQTSAVMGDEKRWYETHVGNCLVIGGGYPGTGPNGQTPVNNQEWIYVSGPVAWALSEGVVVPDRLDQATDLGKNNLVFKASRLAAVGFDGPVYAALVDLTGDYS